MVRMAIEDSNEDDGARDDACCRWMNMHENGTMRTQLQAVNAKSCLILLHLLDILFPGVGT